MNDPKGGVAKVTCRTFEAMGQIPMFHRTYFLFYVRTPKTVRPIKNYFSIFVIIRQKPAAL